MTGERSSFGENRVPVDRARAFEGRSMLHHGIVGTMAAALLAAAPASAGPPDPGAEIAARAASVGAAAQPLLAPVEEARRRGLPAELVADKVLEGLAKGVASERVAAVAGALVGRLAEADAVLAGAAAAGLDAVPDRVGALADLAQALQAGVDRPSLEALVAAARQARSGTAAAVAAARALGQLSRRGVPAAEALPLGRALAARPGQADQLAPLFDTWRAEGGRNRAAFLDEAERRLAAGRPLAGMVDRFGQSPERVVRDAATRRDPDLGGDADRRGGKGLGLGDGMDPARAGTPTPDDPARGKDKKP